MKKCNQCNIEFCNDIINAKDEKIQQLEKENRKLKEDIRELEEERLQMLDEVATPVFVESLKKVFKRRE